MFSQHLEQCLANSNYLYPSDFAVIRPSYKIPKSQWLTATNVYFLLMVLQSTAVTLFRAVGWVQICSMNLPVPETRLKDMGNILFFEWRAGAQEG